RTVPVHHISSTGVFAHPRHDGHPLAVTDPTGPANDLATGYRQSKWVAEQLVGTARQRGLPVSVYRVGIVSGDSTTGACQLQDFVWLCVKGMLETGTVPAGWDGRLSLIPVDYASAAVVGLSLRA